MLMLGLTLPAFGCATMTKGTTQSIAINSSPSGATVIIDGMPMGQTPLTISLARSSNHSGVLSLAGYDDAAFTITRKFTNTTFGNILFGGLIGVGVDAASGANYDLTPDSIYATLGRREQGLAGRR
jgi:hypothetical protein